MTSFAEKRDAHRPRRETVRILADPELVERHGVLDREILDLLGRPNEMIASGREQKVEAMRVALLELEDQIEASCTPFVIEAMGRQKWLTLIGRHPPTKTQRSEGWQYNRLTFPPAALQATVIDPVLTEDDANWLSSELNIADFDTLWAAVELVNVGKTTLPKSLTATVLRPLSDVSSTTPADTASPSPSSEATEGGPHQES